MGSLICVTRWNPSDLAAGASDAAVRDLVISRGGAFRLHPALHAKYYRFDEVVLIGSANITASGLGLALGSNLEILSPPFGGFEFEAFERTLLDQSRVISDAEYEVWKSVPVMPSPPTATPETLTLAWHPNTRDPEDLWLVYSGAAQPRLAAEVRSRAAHDLSAVMAPTGLPFQSFSGWVSAALLASAFVSDVRCIVADDEPRAFLQLGERWNLPPGDARYAAETVRNWLAYFSVST